MNSTKVSYTNMFFIEYQVKNSAIFLLFRCVQPSMYFNTSLMLLGKNNISKLQSYV